MLVRARAKVNLTLRLLGRRGDGYHDLDSVVMPLDLHDDVEVKVNCAGQGAGEAAGGIISPAVATLADGVDCSALGPPEKNLCHRAARAFLARLAPGAPLRKSAIEIRITKRIPLGGGMGGGSADAAATLRALNALAGGEALVEKSLLDVAAEIGSDVPALLLGGPVLMRGRGEFVTRLDPGLFAPLHVLLANPGVSVSTSRAYAESDRLGNARREARELSAMEGPFRTCGDYARLLANDLEGPVFATWPEVGRTARVLREAGAKAVLMSGSGATVFAITDSVKEAERLSAALPDGTWRRITRLAPISS